jgi:septal ring factor EnvC (AmiA/AmiB activator)
VNVTTLSALGALLGALGGASFIASLIGWVRDRRLPKLAAEQARISNVSSELGILERLNDRLEKRCELLEQSLGEREETIIALKVKLARAEDDLATLQARLSQANQDLDDAAP